MTRCLRISPQFPTVIHSSCLPLTSGSCINNHQPFLPFKTKKHIEETSPSTQLISILHPNQATMLRPTFRTIRPFALIKPQTQFRTLRVTAIAQNSPSVPDTSSSGGSPQGPNQPASETTGREPKKDNSGKPGGSSAGSNDTHPAKQPDPQEKPTRSTGIGSQGETSANDSTGKQ